MLGLGTKTAATLRRKMKYSEQGRIRMALGYLPRALAGPWQSLRDGHAHARLKG